MPAPHSNELFQNSGLKGMLDDLNSRLEARELSGREALALLGAVHAGLSQAGSAGRAFYQPYAEFLEALRMKMPDVYDYVNAAWPQRGDTSPGVAATTEAAEFVHGGEAEAEQSTSDNQGGFDDSVGDNEADPAGEEFSQLESASEVSDEEVSRQTQEEYLGDQTGGAGDQEQTRKNDEAEPGEDTDESESPRPELDQGEGSLEKSPEHDPSEMSDSDPGAKEFDADGEPEESVEAAEDGDVVESGGIENKPQGGDESPEWPDQQETQGGEPEAGDVGESPSID